MEAGFFMLDHEVVGSNKRPAMRNQILRGPYNLSICIAAKTYIDGRSDIVFT